MADRKKPSAFKSKTNFGQKTLDELFASRRQTEAVMDAKAFPLTEEAEKLPSSVPASTEAGTADLQQHTEDPADAAHSWSSTVVNVQRMSTRQQQRALDTKRTMSTRSSTRKQATLPFDPPVELTDESSEPSDSHTETIPGVTVQKPALKELSEEGSHFAPIIVASSPVKPDRSTKPLFSIFTTTKAVARTVRSCSPSARAKEQKQLAPPLPDHESQHVRGSQSSFSAPPLQFSRRVVSKGPEPAGRLSLINFNYPLQDHGDLPTSRLPCSASLDRAPENHLSSISIAHQATHPAIAKALAVAANKSVPAEAHRRKLWTERWRPIRADEVLGNESHALYLRDWLLALELQFVPAAKAAQTHTRVNVNNKGKSTDSASTARISKRPRVVRGIEKSRGRKKRRGDSVDSDNWIVNSDESEEEDQWRDEESEDDFEFCSKTAAREQRSEAVEPAPAHLQRDFGDKLTNAILLTGPCGCGKTATVYACADELDWEIFEVNPGVGKRSSTNLDHLVGEVGKNHLVRKTHHRDRLQRKLKQEGPTPERAQQRSFGGLVPSKDLAKESSATKALGFLGANDVVEKDSVPAAPKARQSLILLEEVDILFRDDVNFWPAVINLIKVCQRPVVMTCNDPSLVPVYDLALQSIMKFDPCPTPVAVSYLHALCSAERRYLNRECLVQLYESTYHVPSIDVPDVPLNPFTETLSLPDIRRAINQMQLCLEGHELFDHAEGWLTLEDLADWRLPNSPDSNTPRKRMMALLRHVDAVSFVDSFIVRPPICSPEGTGSCYGPSSDDELGHALLFDPSGRLGQQESLQFYCEDELIARELLKRSREDLMANGDATHMMKAEASLRAHALFRSRVAYQSKVVGALGILPLFAPLLPRPAVFLDYLPWIRHMVQAEDSEAGSEAKRDGRQTANSRRSERMIAISEEHRGDMAHTALAW